MLGHLTLGQSSADRQLLTAIILIAGLLIARTYAASIAGLFFDEVYYWHWSTAMDFGYRDHPPMVAYFVRLGTLIFGNSPLGVRFGSIICHLGSVILVAGISWTLFDSRRAAIWAAVLADLTGFAAFSFIVYPEQPMVMFWLAGMLGLAQIAKGGSSRWWVLVGLAFGMSFASKVTAFPLAFGALAWALTTPEVRKWFRTPWPYAAAALSLVVFSPVLWWNAGHGWITFLMHLDRPPPARSSEQSLLMYLLLVPLMASPAVFALGVAGLFRTTGWVRRMLWLVPLPLALFFVFFAYVGNVGLHLVAPFCYWAAIAASAYFVRGKTGWLVAAGAFGLVVSLGLPFLAAQRFVALPPALDIGRQLTGWHELMASIEQARIANGAEFVATDRYYYPAYMAFYGTSGAPVIDLTQYGAAAPDGVGLFVTRRSNPEEIADHFFGHVHFVGDVSRPMQSGAEAHQMMLVSEPKH